MKDELEGSLVLEKLAEIGALDTFFEAIDCDDFNRVRSLLKKAGVDSETIKMVLEQMDE